MIKKCPHCQKEIDFLKFVMNYGSDTLVPRSKNAAAAHSREHICRFCGKKIWLKYRHQKLYLLTRRHLGILFMLSVAGWFLGRAGLHLESSQAVGLGFFLVFVSLPIYAAYVKYEGVELKPEN